jgi:hypothetical protein
MNIALEALKFLNTPEGQAFMKEFREDTEKFEAGLETLADRLRGWFKL